MTTTGELQTIIQELELLHLGDATSYFDEEMRRDEEWQENEQVAKEFVRRRTMNFQLHKARREKRWTAEETAHKGGVDPQTSRQWEQGKQIPHINFLRFLSQAFERNAQELGGEIIHTSAVNSPIVDHSEIQDAVSEEMSLREERKGKEIYSVYLFT